MKVLLASGMPDLPWWFIGLLILVEYWKQVLGITVLAVALTFGIRRYMKGRP